MKGGTFPVLQEFQGSPLRLGCKVCLQTEESRQPTLGFLISLLYQVLERLFFFPPEVCLDLTRGLRAFSQCWEVALAKGWQLPLHYSHSLKTAQPENKGG